MEIDSADWEWLLGIPDFKRADKLFAFVLPSPYEVNI